MSELFALKWRDINFQSSKISVTRSIVFQVVGPCKTEASQKPIPLDAYLAEALRTWQEYTPYRKPDDWIFASPATSGKNPYWGQSLMRSFIRPAAVKIGIAHIGWRHGSIVLSLLSPFYPSQAAQLELAAFHAK
jgi:integrase